MDKNINPLRIIEDECGEGEDNQKTDNFSKNDQRISLMIVEERDYMMNEVDDHYNNSTNHLHRLSLQIDGSVGDENSLVLTNEAINSTIIKIGSCKGDDDDDNDLMMGDNEHSTNNESIVNLLGQINDIVG